MEVMTSIDGWGGGGGAGYGRHVPVIADLQVVVQSPGSLEAQPARHKVGPRGPM